MQQEAGGDTRPGWKLSYELPKWSTNKTWEDQKKAAENLGLKVSSPASDALMWNLVKIGTGRMLRTGHPEMTRTSASYEGQPISTWGQQQNHDYSRYFLEVSDTVAIGPDYLCEGYGLAVEGFPSVIYEDMPSNGFLIMETENSCETGFKRHIDPAIQAVNLDGRFFQGSGINVNVDWDQHLFRVISPGGRRIRDYQIVQVDDSIQASVNEANLMEVGKKYTLRRNNIFTVQGIKFDLRVVDPHK